MARKGGLFKGSICIMMSSHRNKPKWQIRIAKIHINELLKLAGEVAEKDDVLAKRYIEHARRIAEKFNIRFKREQKLQFCRKCNNYFVPGKTVIYRANPQTKALEVRCLRCGHVVRYRYK